MDAIFGEKTRRLMILFIIIMVGILLRLPIGNFQSADVMYPVDPDSYYYARKAIEYYNLPVSEWKIFDNCEDDPLMNYVFSSYETNNYGDNSTPVLISLCAALICKLFSFLSIHSVIYYSAAIVTPFVAVPAYFFVKKYSNAFGGFVAAFLTALMPSYFFHTTAGFFDTDGFIFFFAFSFMLCHVEVLLESDIRKKTVYALISFLLIIIFSFGWRMYFVYVAIAVIMSVVFVALKFFKKENAQFVFLLLHSVVLTAYSFITDWGRIWSMMVNILVPSTKNNWPDPGKFIGELSMRGIVADNPNTGFNITGLGIVNYLGGYVFLVAVILSFYVFARINLHKKGDKLSSVKYENNLIIPLMAWVLVTFVISLKGVRYVQLLALPLTILVSYTFGVLFNAVGQLDMRGLKKDFFVILLAVLMFGAIWPIDIRPALILALAVLMIGLLSQTINFKTGLFVFLVTLVLSISCCCYKISEKIISSSFLTEGFRSAAEFISSETPSDSTIVSWWGPGYFYQYAGKRQTVADGGTYSGEYFYWLANAFVTDNPNLSKGICNMLKGGSVDASKLAREYAGSDKAGAELLKSILVLDKADAKNRLVSEYDLTGEQADELVSLSHPSVSKPIYILVGVDDLKRATVLAYYGFWDFQNEQTYEYNYDYVFETDKEFFPEELKDSVLLSLWFDDSAEGFTEVFSDETIKVFSVG